jgi:hypothetical protein
MTLPPIICITLPERRERLCQHLNKHGLSYELFPAFTRKQTGLGSIACLTLSNLAVLKMALLRAWDSLLVFEDDVVLVPGFVERFERMRAKLPENWTSVHLGYAPMWPSAVKTPLNNMLAYACPLQTEAMYYSRRGIELLANYATGLGHWDLVLKNFFADHPGLVCWPEIHKLADQLSTMNQIPSAIQVAQ